MSKPTQYRIGAFALLVSFMRVKVGKEFEIAARLSKRFPKKPGVVSYYTCYGQYDLLELLMVDSYETTYELPFDEDIIDYEFSIFYSWENISQLVDEWVKGFPALTLVLFKIQPELEESLTFDIEKSIIERIKNMFTNEANLFLGMGRSEILLLLRGTSFEKLLSTISQLRQTLTITQVIMGEYDIPEDCDANMPVFIGSTTFPVIAHPALQGNADYGKFEGKVMPRVNVTCYPGYERIVVQNKPPSCLGAYNIYGSYDVALAWNEPIELSQFAQELTEFRRRMSEFDGIKGTMTTFVGLDEIVIDESSNELPSLACKSVSELFPGTEDILKKSEKLDPTIRAQLFEFLDRLNGYYRRRDSKSSFQDMTGLRHLIISGLNELEGVTEYEADRYNTFLSEIIDLGNNALYQRYTGLETHFEICNHLPYPFLHGINGYIAAASCIPNFIFKSVFPEFSIHEKWNGFVLFGLSYSYQLLTGKILSYQANSLNKPIEDWWGITHEVAHAIYQISDFYEKECPDDIKEYFKKLDPPSEFWIDLEEIYANWFDFRYIFEGDVTRYFPTIWKSWLRWDRIWQLKLHYIIRSLAIYIGSNIEDFSKTRNLSYPHTEKYLESKFGEMRNLISLKVPRFNEFVKDITPEDITETTPIFKILEHYLKFLQRRYFNQGIYDRINCFYPEELLTEHIRSLEKGIIVAEKVPNPVRFLQRLYSKYFSSDFQVPLRVNAATILTLWYNYIRFYKV
jgi:hypothetical protein